MSSRTNPFQDFQKLSEKIYLLEPDVKDRYAPTSSKQPTIIIIFAWGDGSPKHVVKYVHGFRKLYSTSRIIVVLCTLLESMIQSVSNHSRAMQPVVDAIFSAKNVRFENDQILVQVMSNSGAVSFIATILAYKSTRRMMGESAPKPFPHTLLVCDSTPGGLYFWSNISRWSQALALSSAEWAPLPVFLMRTLYSIALILVEGLSLLTGWHKTQIGRTLAEGIRDPDLMTNSASRLYMYSKNDELVPWEDVEDHIAVARERGYDNCTTERFDQSSHVGHMKLDPESYWTAIATAWDTALKRERA